LPIYGRDDLSVAHSIRGPHIVIDSPFSELRLSLLRSFCAASLFSLLFSGCCDRWGYVTGVPAGLFQPGANQVVFEPGDVGSEGGGAESSCLCGKTALAGGADFCGPCAAAADCWPPCTHCRRLAMPGRPGKGGNSIEEDPTATPPHSRFHPVPTRPAFAPLPEYSPGAPVSDRDSDGF
jgi:hypothetical protein